MTRLRLTAAARADLVDIRIYGVEQFGGAAADAYFRRFRDVFRLLRDRPSAGSPQADLGDDVRCFTHRRHCIFYRVIDVDVKVLRIIHHARNMTITALRDDTEQ